MKTPVKNKQVQRTVSFSSESEVLEIQEAVDKVNNQTGNRPMDGEMKVGRVGRSSTGITNGDIVGMTDDLNFE